VVIDDWLRSLKLFWDLHIFRHVNKYVNELETTPKQSHLNVLELFQCFVSHVRASETKHCFWICFRFVLRCFVSVVRAALVPKLVAMAMSLRCKVSAISAFSRPTTYTLSITSCLVTVVHTKPVITILVSKLVAMATSLSIWGLPSNI